jgi:hypothetical protein
MTNRSAGSKPDQLRKKPKRGQREGTVYQRRDGVWVGRIMLGRKTNGKPDRRKLTGPTKADVQRQLAELRLRTEQGQLVDSSQGRETVAVYLTAWLEAAGTTTRPQTLAGYRQIVRDHIIPTLGRHKLNALRVGRQNMTKGRSAMLYAMLDVLRARRGDIDRTTSGQFSTCAPLEVLAKHRLQTTRRAVRHRAHPRLG